MRGKDYQEVTCREKGRPAHDAHLSREYRSPARRHRMMFEARRVGASCHGPRVSPGRVVGARPHPVGNDASPAALREASPASGSRCSPCYECAAVAGGGSHRMKPPSPRRPALPRNPGRETPSPRAPVSASPSSSSSARGVYSRPYDPTAATLVCGHAAPEIEH